jgi:hypothetical protein
MTRRLPELDREAVTVAHSGTCPLCDRYIRRGRSRVAALSVPLRPSTEHVHYRAHRGGRRDKGEWVSMPDGRPLTVQPRRWAHELCARRHARDTAGQRPRDVAKQRTDSLIAHKAAMQEHCDG